VLSVRNEIPDGFLDCPATELHCLFDGPTLIHIPGSSPEPLFVSILLHGNEISGLLIVQELLRRYRNRAFPRAWSLLVGNVAAARAGRRSLPGNHDYNRIWLDGRDAEHQMTREVLAQMHERSVFAAVDLHNNTSRNPIYAIVARRDPRHLQLARAFSKIVVYSEYPATTSTVAFSDLCPAITIEAGLPGEPEGVLRAVAFLEQCLQMSTIVDETPADTDLFHTVAVVKVPRLCSCGLVGEDVDVQLFPDIDRYNFCELMPGTVLARLRPQMEACLEISPTNGAPGPVELLAVDDGEVRVRRPVMPAMLTTNRDIISLDCLCYLMERLS